MRTLIAPVAALALLAGAGLAGAETKIFIIENQRDGYGVDRCLANGADCGKPVASAYCQAREFGNAVSFRKVERDEITGGTVSCRGARCNEYVAIECTR
jgi:hypothetical protein